MANYGMRGVGDGTNQYDLQVTNGSNYGGLSTSVVTCLEIM